eukprot:m.88135 g.88135  ORF g.88135 m.88135 type:complete len:107 (-) comp8352_c0_seq1:165-485(-)
MAVNLGGYASWADRATDYNDFRSDLDAQEADIKRQIITQLTGPRPKAARTIKLDNFSFTLEKASVLDERTLDTSNFVPFLAAVLDEGDALLALARKLALSKNAKNE